MVRFNNVELGQSASRGVWEFALDSSDLGWSLVDLIGYKKKKKIMSRDYLRIKPYFCLERKVPTCQGSQPHAV